MASILDYFEPLADSRREHKKQHKLCYILFITLAAVICECVTNTLTGSAA